ncbi:MAG TPA: hypothetical protein VF547_10750 [Allosphingosinicella sp.]|jgi:hypothetical protein
MRTLLFLGAAGLLAACGPRESGGSAGASTGPTPATATPAETAVPPAPAEAEPIVAAAIPGPFLGVYDASREACGRSSDARLTVSAGELRFHESIATVRKVTPVGADSVRVEADYQGEGERWRNVRDLRLGAGGTELTVSGDGTRFTRVRCPAATR